MASQFLRTVGRDGLARQFGTAVDIGAYEVQPHSDNTIFADGFDG